ncbi:cytochrome bo3 quinol oxidase subunit 2 [Chromohalobacter marismortui]|uniref:Ubiquinol oxidase subunit 2 n=1 Tax=Chromohalobacter marismortui TaxID=42055 RepID=A0A4R7NRN7_9GAMM|nr:MULTISPECIES: ubiquinol oxidase subunit II [Chromohalobacter]MCI0511319.1 ubiquinol oxidase subunit II [Chromohalobacter sp.]MCI0594069.1 ubiquinol oxidase subunit II [Chromohalobacter sp.]TDU23664.1 cytochrome bo3 quinol oxidase subunit 2 [Chromohalobacter marismortui]
MRMKKNLGWLGVLPLIAVLLSGCDAALVDPKGLIGEQLKSLIITAFWLMMIVVIPVIVMTVVFAWKYRHSNHAAKYLPDWAHSNKIEVVVWLVPCIIILFLGIITWKTSHSLDPHKPLAPASETMEVQVVALDWKWLFIYPKQGIATVNQVAMPVDVPVHFRVTSASVMNSFFIPTLGSQIYAMAGMDNDVYLVANETGVFAGKSSNYSGRGFSEMTFDALALSKDDFEDWVDKVGQAPQTLSFKGSYQELAEPSTDHPVEYFSDVTPNLYRNIIQSFKGGSGQSGHGEGHGEKAMSAEAAE